MTQDYSEHNAVRIKHGIEKVLTGKLTRVDLHKQLMALETKIGKANGMVEDAKTNGYNDSPFAPKDCKAKYEKVIAYTLDNIAWYENEIYVLQAVLEGSKKTRQNHRASS